MQLSVSAGYTVNKGIIPIFRECEYLSLCPKLDDKQFNSCLANDSCQLLLYLSQCVFSGFVLYNFFNAN